MSNTFAQHPASHLHFILCGPAIGLESLGPHGLFSMAFAVYNILRMYDFCYFKPVFESILFASAAHVFAPGSCYKYFLFPGMSMSLSNLANMVRKTTRNMSSIVDIRGSKAFCLIPCVTNTIREVNVLWAFGFCHFGVVTYLERSCNVITFTFASFRLEIV